MTQFSNPQAGHNSTGLLDAGPYTADQWAIRRHDIATKDQGASRGVVPERLNMLRPTESLGIVTVDTGVGVVGGRDLRVDAAVTFSPAAASANPRIDVVVLCLNNTAIGRTVGIASGNNLIFPTSLVDYGGVAELPPFTARLCILEGTEAASPTAPTLDADLNTLYMVPLAQYQIDTGGSISAFVDRRLPIVPGATVPIDSVDGGSGSLTSLSLSVPDSTLYSTLVLVGRYFISRVSGGPTTEQLLLQVNGVTSANYAYDGDAATAAAQTSIIVSDVYSDTPAFAIYSATCHARFPSPGHEAYAGSGVGFQMISHACFDTGSGVVSQDQVGKLAVSGGIPITSFTLFNSLGLSGFFSPATRFDLYGVTR